MKFFCRSLLPILLGSTLFAAISSNLNFFASAQPAIRESSEFSIARMGLAGIKLGDKGTKVQQILGKPKQTRVERTTCCGTLHHWKYPQLEVSFDDSESTNDPKRFSVYQVVTKSSKFATLEGIRVGDRRNKILQVYGKAGVTQEGNILFYVNNPSASSLVFRLKNDRVEAITVSTQLN